MLVILLGWIKSQAQESKCLTQNQIHNVNEYRKTCDVCFLDLKDVSDSLKECRSTGSGKDHSLSVVTGVIGFLLGALIIGSVKH